MDVSNLWSFASGLVVEDKYTVGTNFRAGLGSNMLISYISLVGGQWTRLEDGTSRIMKRMPIWLIDRKRTVVLTTF